MYEFCSVFGDATGLVFFTDHKARAYFLQKNERDPALRAELNEVRRP